MCELLVGLPEMNVLAVVDEVGEMLRVHVETRLARTGCERCGVVARVKERPLMELVDLPCFGRPTRLVWHKRRWSCLEETCSTGSWTEEDIRIGAARMAMSDRAGRWVTEQVGRYAARPERERGGHRARVRLAHGERHDHRLRLGPGGR